MRCSPICAPKPKRWCGSACHRELDRNAYGVHALSRTGSRGRSAAADGPLDPDALRAAFDRTYARVYGRVIPRLEVEAVTWTLSLAEPYDLPERPMVPADAAAAAPIGRCRIVEPISGEAVDASLFARGALLVGARLPDLPSSSRTARQPLCRVVMWRTLVLPLT